MKIIIQIPLKLTSEANCNEPWYIKNKRHKAQRAAVAWKMREIGEKISLPCTVKLIRASPRKYDSDNLQSAFKYIRDQIANELIPGKRSGMTDSDPRIKWEYDSLKVKKDYYVLLEFDCNLSA
jgi:hypothetical protein